MAYDLKRTQLMAASWDIEIEAADSSHPNELKFKGVLVPLDSPSTNPPNGSRGHRIKIPVEVAKRRVSSLVGMGVNYSEKLDAHAPLNKVGVIQKAWVEGKAIKVSGIVWVKDFPDAKDVLDPNSPKGRGMGMSFEASHIQVQDEHADVWVLSDLIFTGAAILKKNKAAYFHTEALAASSSHPMYAKLIKADSGDNSMPIQNGKDKKKKNTSVSASATNTELATMISAAISASLKPLTTALLTQNASISQLTASFAAAEEDKVLAEAEEVEADADEDVDAESDDDDDDDMETKKGGKKVKAAKKKKADDADEDDDDSDDDEDDDEVDAGRFSKLADDADDLDQDTDDVMVDGDDAKPGKFNNNFKNQGRKGTTGPAGGKQITPNVKASQKVVAALAKQNKAFKAQAELNKQLKQQVRALQAQAEKFAEATERRTISASASPRLKGLLSKEGVDISASAGQDGQKMSAADFDTMLGNAQITDVVQRMTLKTEASKIGIID